MCEKGVADFLLAYSPKPAAWFSYSRPSVPAGGLLVCRLETVESQRVHPITLHVPAGGNFPCLPRPALPCHARPCRAEPCLPRRDVPFRAAPSRASPARPCHAEPGLPQPSRAMPCHACPTAPFRHTPSAPAPLHAEPGHACHAMPAGPAFPRQARPRLPSRCVPCPAWPSRAEPSQACRAGARPAMPRLALPARSGRAAPCPDMPRLTSPCLPCLRRRFTPRCTPLTHLAGSQPDTLQLLQPLVFFLHSIQISERILQHHLAQCRLP